LRKKEIHSANCRGDHRGTVNGAAALGLADNTGQLAPGFSADVALFDVDDVWELPYWYGERRLRASWCGGRTCHRTIEE